MNFYQIGIFLLQGILVSFLILLLFHLRKKSGIGLLFACLGLFQFMQVFLSSTVYVKIADNFLVSPGSSVLFTVTLFAILIIYIKEDASETRKIIYALLIVNIVMSLLLQSFGWNIKESSTHNPFNVSTHLFDNNAWVLFVGTVALFIDSVLIVIIFEFLSRKIPFLFLQIFATMLIAVSFDTVFFSILSFWSYDNLKTIIISGLISKGFFALFYSIVFSVYLKYFDKKQFKTGLIHVKDVFEPLTYRQKFESTRLDAIKASEEAKLKDIKYRTLTKISPVGIFHTRADGYTTFVNRKWCEISGLSENEGIGNNWLKAVHPDDIERVRKGWEKATTEKRDSGTQYRFLLSDGSVKWVLGRAVPEFDSQNQIIGYVGTITDITEIINFQHEQIELKEKAEESDRLKSAFLANMSHEIRTPMNGILGFSDLLSDPDLTNEEQANYIALINKSGQRMLNIINDIVDISKIEAGLLEIQLSKTNINDQIEYLYNFFLPQAKSKGLLLSVKNSLSGKAATIITDREKLYSILTNLIKNAIKYTKVGEIELGCTHKENYLEFYVKDTGIGIPKERQQAIFERFIQADIDDCMAYQGAGLGLAIAKAYVEMLGGKIRVESEEGKGSVFYFTISCKREPEQKNAEVQPAVPGISDETSKLKILIVEDDETSEILLRKTIHKFSREILVSRTGLEAIELSRSNPDIELILMDIRMPAMGGYEATRQIRQFNKKVIIIAQTAFGFSGDREKALEAGCDDYISKPISIHELQLLIKKYFGN